MAPSLPELAEDAQAFLDPTPEIDRVERPGLLLLVRDGQATVVRVRHPDLEWVRAECRRRGVERVEWWLGWSAPPEVAGELRAAGLVPDEVPTLTGMTCTAAPPAAPEVEVRRILTAEALLEALAVDWEVWAVPQAERERRREAERRRFRPDGPVQHWAAWLDGRCVGFGRAIDMPQGAALMGGAVLAEARGRGAYRALVRARWDHAAARGTPLLVVQAGAMSAPVLEGLGFLPHGEIHLLVDRL